MHEFAAIDGNGVRLREPAPESVLMLRVWRPDEAVLAALARAFDQAWPMQPNTAASLGDGGCAAWLAPGEWLLIGVDAAAVAATATAALGGALHHLSDVSAASFRVTIEGANARRLIAKACSLDLHPRAFGPGGCARTLFAQLPAFVRRCGPDGFDLHVDVSWRDYLLTWLRQAIQDIQP